MKSYGEADTNASRMAFLIRHLLIALAAVALSSCAVLSPSYPTLSGADNEPGYQPASIENTDWLVFSASTEPETGVVYYPGGKVDPEAYSAQASSISQATGALVIIVPMPLDLAILGGRRGEQVRMAFPDIRRWVIGGHSLGGTMAAAQAYKHPDHWQGLFLLASYPQDKHDFSSRQLKVLTVTGEKDGLISVGRWQESMALLPGNTQSLIIDGGNHAGFGNYGDQKGDQPATISPEQQQRYVTEAFSRWLMTVPD